MLLHKSLEEIFSLSSPEITYWKAYLATGPTPMAAAVASVRLGIAKGTLSKEDGSELTLEDFLPAFKKTPEREKTPSQLEEERILRIKATFAAMGAPAPKIKNEDGAGKATGGNPRNEARTALDPPERPPA